jgi:negative regulator of flagellin synthesis FlgM
MKIVTSTIPKPATASAAPAASGRAGAKGATAASATPSGAVGTSAAAAGVDPATRLSQLEAQFSQSDFDAAKVSEVTSAIASGQYKVNASAVADKLLESTGSLGVKSGGNG